MKMSYPTKSNKHGVVEQLEIEMDGTHIRVYMNRLDAVLGWYALNDFAKNDAVEFGKQHFRLSAATSMFGYYNLYADITFDNGDNITVHHNGEQYFWVYRRGDQYTISPMYGLVCAVTGV